MALILFCKARKSNSAGEKCSEWFDLVPRDKNWKWKTAVVASRPRGDYFQKDKFFLLSANRQVSEWARANVYSYLLAHLNLVSAISTPANRYTFARAVYMRPQNGAKRKTTFTRQRRKIFFTHIKRFICSRSLFSRFCRKKNLSRINIFKILELSRWYLAINFADAVNRMERDGAKLHKFPTFFCAYSNERENW